MSQIGKRVIRIDARKKVTGEALYGGDFRGPDTPIVGVIRSPHPHCDITKIEAKTARAMKGVIAVFLADDIDGTNTHGLIRRDQEVFCRKRARFMGDALGIIVAKTPKILKKALKSIHIDYESLPILGSVQEALAENAPKIHESGNVLSNELIRKGNAEKAFKNAAHIVQTTTITQSVDHAFLDREAGWAYMDGEVVTIYASGQWVHEDQRLVSLALGLPLEKVRIIQPETGGAFGGREDISIQIYLGLAALKLNRPVRIEYSREESMIARHKRHPVRIEYSLAANERAEITAAKVIIHTDEGAYASTGQAVLRKAVSHCTGPYRVPNITADGVAVFTNCNPTGAMRGFGAAQLAIAIDRTIAAMARKVEMDLVEFKRLNLLTSGGAVATGQRIPVVTAIDVLDVAAEKIGWENRSYQTSASHLKRGFGISSVTFGLGYGDGFPDASRARVQMKPDGSFVVYSGGVDFGQGLHTLMAQFVAHELGVQLDKVEVIASDTAKTPESGSTSATRQTVFTGNAVRLAASELKHQLLDIASATFALHPEELSLKNGKIGSLSLKEMYQIGKKRGFSLDITSVYKPRTVPGDQKTGKSPRAYLTYMFVSHAAEVLVDIETGKVRVERLVAVHDVGKAINPQQVEGQIEGGVIQGLGMALMEEVLYAKGQMLNANFTDYIIPTMVDSPRVEPVILEHDDPEGPYGARGVGEPSLIGTPPAIVLAIEDAIKRPIQELPATAERVWRVLQE